MKIILVSIGTRGDMEPFLAIGELLQAREHEVLCLFPEQFRALASQSGLKFESLGEKFIKLLESDDGKAAMGGASGWKKIIGTIRLAMNQTDANKELVFNQRKIIDSFNPDCILYNGKAVYPILWNLRTKGKIVFISPLPFMHYVKGHTHIAFNSNYGEFFNKLTFSLAQFGLITTLKISEKWLDIKPRFKRKAIKQILQNGSSIYTISPTLFKRPVYWQNSLRVLGFHQKKHQQDYIPPLELQSFLKAHKKILFITFGSMTNADPEGKTRLILDILRRNKIPAIINTASGGLLNPEGFKDQTCLFVSKIPYEWIFSKVYGVMHHGGSGTTHIALKYGCPSMIIPHIIDQFAWNQIIANLGVGPLGVKINKLNIKRLEPKILDLFHNPVFKEKAKQIQIKMAEENYTEDLLKEILK